MANRKPRQPCSVCGRVHTAISIAAVGRFDPDGPRGYRSLPDGPIRATRQEAMHDHCPGWTTEATP